MTYRLVVFVFSLLCGLSCQLSAQKGLELGGWAGAAYYFGDLNTNYRLTKPGFAGGLNVRYNLNTRLSAKGSINYAKLRASDADSDNQFEKDRNLAFYNDIFELTGQFEFNFFPYVHGSQDYWYTPYIFGGMSAFYHDPKRKLDGTTYALRDFGTEGQAPDGEYLPFSGAFTFGGGFKWDIAESWSMNIEFGVRKIFTDHIDDVSGAYPDAAALAASRDATAVLLSSGTALNANIIETGRQRGNSKDNDTYNLIGVSIMKYFGDLACPKISNNFN